MTNQPQSPSTSSSSSTFNLDTLDWDTVERDQDLRLYMNQAVPEDQVDTVNQMIRYSWAEYFVDLEIDWRDDMEVWLYEKEK